MENIRIQLLLSPMSNSLPLVRVLVSKYPVLYQKSNCDNFDDAEEVVFFFQRNQASCTDKINTIIITSATSLLLVLVVQSCHVFICVLPMTCIVMSSSACTVFLTQSCTCRHYHYNAQGHSLA